MESLLTEVMLHKAIASIDKAAIHIDYQLFSNQALVLHDQKALLQSLEQLQLEITHQKQHHKLLCRVDHASGNIALWALWI